MRIAGRIDEQGWRSAYTSTKSAPAEVEAALAAFDVLFLPLAIEVELEGASPAIYLDPKSPAGLPVCSTVEPAPQPKRSPLDAKSVRGLLGSRVEWRRIEVLASAARVAEETDSLVLEQFPNRILGVELRATGRFIAGPIDADGWRTFPPVAARLLRLRGQLRVELAVYWSPWADVEAREHVFHRRAQKALETAGFMRD